MIRIFFSILMLSLVSCTGPQGVINIDVPKSDHSLTVLDQRPDKEKKIMAKCVVGPGFGVGDDAFNPPRLDVLSAHLAASFPRGVSKVVVKRFHSCVALAPSPAAIAAISYPIAIAFEGSGNGDIITTIIELDVDGVPVAGSDVVTYRAGFVFANPLDTEETRKVLIESFHRALNNLVSAYGGGQ